MTQRVRFVKDVYSQGMGMPLGRGLTAHKGQGRSAQGEQTAARRREERPRSKLQGRQMKEDIRKGDNRNSMTAPAVTAPRLVVEGIGKFRYDLQSSVPLPDSIAVLILS